MENKIKLNQITNKDFIRYTQKEVGITLVALIITIVIMVIIAVISITIVYNSKIVEYAINGTYNYAGEGIKENKVLEGTESLIDSAIDNIKKINAGNISSIEPTSPEPTGLTKEELVKDEMVGKYVDYKSQGTNYIVEGAYSGTDSNQTFLKNDNMKWRIWGVEGNKLLLISEVVAGDIRLQGANGYNNVVKILNDACSTAYGNSNYGNAIKVRSINQEDIDRVTGITTDALRKVVTPNYGSSYSPSSNYNWPNIYGYETGKSEGGNLERSEQYNNNWVTGTSNKTFTGKYTYYSYNIQSYAIQTIHDALLTNPIPNSTLGSYSSSYSYWVASRCVNIRSGDAFCVFYVGSGHVKAFGLYSVLGELRNDTYSVRPIVEVNLELVRIGGTGSGTNTDPYSMVLK